MGLLSSLSFMLQVLLLVGGSKEICPDFEKVVGSVGSNIDLQRAGGLALIDATKQGKIFLAECLMKNKIDLNVRDTRGNTALHWALGKKTGKERIARALISKGADIDLVGPGNYSPLMIANLGGYLEVAEEIIKMGAELNTRTTDGYSALIHAAGENLEDIVELLIEYKADLDIQDKDGWSALMYASSRGNEDVAKALVDAGARIDLKNIDGKDAVTLASDEGYTEIESYIRKKISHSAKTAVSVEL